MCASITLQEFPAWQLQSTVSREHKKLLSVCQRTSLLRGLQVTSSSRAAASSGDGLPEAEPLHLKRKGMVFQSICFLSTGVVKERFCQQCVPECRQLVALLFACA